MSGPLAHNATPRIISGARMVVLHYILMRDPDFRSDSTVFRVALKKYVNNFDLILIDIDGTPYRDLFLFAYNVGDIFDDHKQVIETLVDERTLTLQLVANKGLQTYQDQLSFVSTANAEAWLVSASQKLKRLLASAGQDQLEQLLASGGQDQLDASFGPGVTPAGVRLVTSERLLVLKRILETNAEYFMHDSDFWEAHHTHSANFDLMLVDLKPRTYYDRLLFAWRIGEIFVDNSDVAVEISRLDYGGLQAMAEQELYPYLGFYREWSPDRAERWRSAASPDFSELIRSMVSENSFAVVEPPTLEPPIEAESTPGTVRLLTSDRITILKMIALEDIEGREGISAFGIALDTHFPNFDLVLQDVAHTSYYDRLIFAYQIGDIFLDKPRAADQIIELGYINLRQVAASNLESYLGSMGFQSREEADTWMARATNKLFHIEPSVILMCMIRDQTIPVGEAPRGEVVQFFLNQPDFNIREVSINTAANTPDAFERITNKDAVLNFLRMLQRTQALTTTPTAIPVLIAKGYTSAVGVAFQYLNNFVSSVGPDIPPRTAKTIHGRAVRILNRNESAMTRLLEAVQGTSIAALDGTTTALDRIRLINNLGGARFQNINLESLFGSMDSDPCDDCNSVTSPAAYFVELLEFLRSNNLENGITLAGSNPSGVAGTVLGHFFARRPDLGNLELSCPNTNAVLPYLDLANEVMESYVVHLDEQVLYHPNSGPVVVQTVLDVYNTQPTDGELLSEPQHTNSKAYSILSNQIYPFNKLPYDQSLDEVRIFLKHLGTSRYELLKTYRARLDAPVSTVEDRAMVAEYLNITQAEYLALTGEAFDGRQYTVNEWEYWGYPHLEAILDPRDTSRSGLFYIDEFLPRSGMELPDLVELLKTEFINPTLARRDAILIFPGRADQFFRSIMRRVDTALTLGDYARIRQIMKLQRKLGWSIGEVDRAISASSVPGTRPVVDSQLLEQLVAVLKVLDITRLERPVLLTFWSPISVHGEDSLYHRLFLTPHITGIDSIFRPDDEGNYLSSAATISQHEIVVLASLGLTKEGMDTIRRKKRIGDELSLANLGALYRHAVMAKHLRVTASVLFKAIDIFGDPFASPTACLAFLELWNRMKAAGVSFAQLNYILRGEDDPLKPLFPSELKIDATIKKLLDGQAAHPAIGGGTKEEQEAQRQFQQSLAIDLIITTVAALFSLSYDTARDLVSYTRVDGASAIEVFQLPDPENTKRQTKVEILHIIARAAINIKIFNLSDDEVRYVAINHIYKRGLAGGDLALARWERLLVYVELRDSLPKTTDQPLSGLFHSPPAPGDLSKRISALILVDRKTVDRVLARFGSREASYFIDEMVLTAIKKACDFAGKVAIDVEGIFRWANPQAQFHHNRRTAIEIRGSIRAKSSADDWAAIFKPLRDELRQNQREALIAYLLVQPKLKKWGVIDADSLFEFFLIDVQMGPCLETSRIKQAISSVQLFVQRCLCGMEKRYGVESSMLDRKRWDWMQKYRVWEANRKVFLYPENWIEPSLRDDKSPFFNEFEADLMQRDLNTQSMQDAVKNYVSRIDEVANLRVIALYAEEQTPDLGNELKLDKNTNTDGWLASVPTGTSSGRASSRTAKRGTLVHFFARTRATPYAYYYRVYDKTADEWRPWGKMDIEVQSHEEQSAAENGGTFLIPVVVDGRLLVFTPQIVKYVKRNESGTPDASKQLGMTDQWEIRIGWTELRNGKWTAKKMSSALIRTDMQFTRPETVTPSMLYPILLGWPVFHLVAIPGVQNVTLQVPISALHFSSRFSGSGDVDIILGRSVDNADQQFLGLFRYNSGRVTVVTTNPYQQDTPRYAGEFNAMVLARTASSPLEISVRPVHGGTNDKHKDLVATSGDMPSTVRFDSDSDSALPFHHRFSNRLLKHTSASSTLDDLYDTLASIPSAFMSPHELKEPNALYNWELGLHVPMLLMEQLTSSHQYDKALEIAHYVFDPLSGGSGVVRAWKWTPFQSVTVEGDVKAILNALLANDPNTSINNWRNAPFQPHLVARDRPMSYMKWIVMKYISILIASGDQMFRQNTMETVPLAIQYYTMAAHLYGPPGHVITATAKRPPRTYNSLLSKWDAFSNAMIDFESAFPFVRVYNGQTGRPISRYFCVPDNPKLKELRATIDDRLYKIRHCQDINGNAIKLALFEPPIDPGSLVRATANGISLSNVMEHLGGPMPNYRFRYLLQKAFEMVHELRSLGDAFLAAKEKKDSQSYELIRIGHETTINALVLDMKRLSCDEANKSLDSLRQARNGPFSRLKHYAQLIGEDTAKYSEDALQFAEIDSKIQKPVASDSLVLTIEEKSEISYSIAAATSRAASKATEAVASTILIFPTPEVHTEPLGIGMSVKGGPKNVAEGVKAVAAGLGAIGESLEAVSVNSSKKAGLIRQFQDRVLQANAAGHELEVINAQIEAQQIHVTVAEKDIELQQKQIDSANATHEFLRSKYTNEALYSWQETQLRTLYYQTYTLTYDLAQKVEKTYQFERGLTATNFIQESWDASRDGLYSAEALSLGLKRLEAAHQESRGYDYEITKHVSLRQINPRELLKLRELGKCGFSVPERLFDMDFPGHYNRRIKSVSLSIPCVVGPYTSINSTLQLVSHKYRVSKVAADYDTEDQKFRSDKIPIQSVAISSGQNDSGVFELNFNDERYIPFEGAGAISDWILELPNLHAFDYRSISDAILHIRYTSMSGGEQLQKSAIAAYETSIADASTPGGGLFAFFDIKNQFANDWYRFGGTQSLKLAELNTRLPFLTRGRNPTPTKIELFSSGNSKFTMVAMPDSTPITFLKGEEIEKGVTVISAETGDLGDWNWELKSDEKPKAQDELWMVVRYTLDRKT